MGTVSQGARESCAKPDFSRGRLLLAVFVFYISGIVQYVLFCAWLLSFNILPVAMNHSFSLLYSSV